MILLLFLRIPIPGENIRTVLSNLERGNLGGREGLVQSSGKYHCTSHFAKSSKYHGESDESHVPPSQKNICKI